MPRVKRNFKGRSPNVLRFIESGGGQQEVSELVSQNLAAGSRLAAENQSHALDENTVRTYELRLMELEKFALQNEDDAVLFGPNKTPFLKATILTFLQVTSERKGKRIGSLTCRGLKPPSVKIHVAALRHWMSMFGHTGPYVERVVLVDGKRKLIPSGNPMEDPGVKQTIKQLMRRAVRPTRSDARHGMKPYEAKKAPPFSLDDLLRMRNYCLKSVQGIRGLWLWTISVFSFALFLRSAEPLSIKAKHLKFPKNYNPDSCEVPTRIEVKIPYSKVDRKAKGTVLTLWSNPLLRELCSVTALLNWLLITGIKKGYIFPRVSRNNRSVCPKSARGATSYRKSFKQMAQALFEKEFTTHSIRRSAAQWAARCGADDSTIRRAGRWKSNSFELYTQDARAEMIKQHHEGNPVSDYRKWMFKPLR